MKSFVGVNDDGKVTRVGGSCKARDLRGQISEIDDFLRRVSE